MTTCPRCNKERFLLVNGLCHSCDVEVDAQIERNLELAKAFTVELKAKMNWHEERGK